MLSVKSNPEWSSPRKLKLISDVVMPSVDPTNNKTDKEDQEDLLQLPKSSIWLMLSDMNKLPSTSQDLKLTSRNT